MEFRKKLKISNLFSRDEDHLQRLIAFVGIEGTKTCGFFHIAGRNTSVGSVFVAESV